MVTRRIVGLFSLSLLVVGSELFAQAAPPVAIVTLRGRELTAINIATTHFRRLNPGVDLKHYDVEITRRRNQLEIAFIADFPERTPPPDARTGGGTIYGPDMIYTISMPRLKIIRYIFQR
jgi:hypothetical protein